MLCGHLQSSPVAAYGAGGGGECRTDCISKEACNASLLLIADVIMSPDTLVE